MSYVSCPRCKLTLAGRYAYTWSRAHAASLAQPSASHSKRTSAIPTARGASGRACAGRLPHAAPDEGVSRRPRSSALVHRVGSEPVQRRHGAGRRARPGPSFRFPTASARGAERAWGKCADHGWLILARYTASASRLILSPSGPHFRRAAMSPASSRIQARRRPHRDAVRHPHANQPGRCDRSRRARPLQGGSRA